MRRNRNVARSTAICLVDFFSDLDRTEGRKKKASGILMPSMFTGVKDYTMPEKPMNAKASMAAVTRAIGIPFIPLGTLASESCSRSPAKMMRANPKPKAFATV